MRSIPNKIKPSLETFNFVTILLPRRTWILAQFIDIEKRRSSALHVALASSSRVRRHGGGARIVIASPGAAMVQSLGAQTGKMSAGRHRMDLAMPS